MQFALALRHRELVIRLGKVINANVLIASFGQCVDGIAEHGKLSRWVWQVCFFYLTLGFKAFWQMRVVKYRQTIW